eukprot:2630659-Karenia_brevis.AAC.1
MANTSNTGCDHLKDFNSQEQANGASSVLFDACADADRLNVKDFISQEHASSEKFNTIAEDDH